MDNPNPTFSIIVPVYKVEAYLPQCLDSILGQSIPDFELILVDDGSTDSSGAICDQYARDDGRVRVIHKTNGGQSTARNAGLEIAGGRYVLFIDSDDWLEKDALARLLPLLAEEPDVIVYSFFYRFDNAPVSGSTSLRGFPSKCSGGEFLRCMATRKVLDLSVPWNKVYRRQLFEENRIRFIEGIINEDGPFFLETFLLAEKVAVLDQPLYSYRKGRADATTSSNSIRNFDSLMTGIAHTRARLRGTKWDKYVNRLLLTYAVFATTQRYKTAEDTRLVLERSSSKEYRQMLRKLWRQAHFSWDISLLAAMILCGPRLTKKLLRTL